MTDEPTGRDPVSTPTSRGRRFKPHEVTYADGGRLLLRADGSILHVDSTGATLHLWAPDDAQWPDQAIRFGLHTQAPTITPQGPVQGTKPPRR
jgi:hypothetical protein